MNAMSDLHPDAAEPSLDALLAPLSPEAPCGGSIRHELVFTEIRLLREEDDPALPMGQWERPLKRADWPRIERLCTEILSTRSKDLQLGLWLAESWMRQRGFAGLMNGLRLVDGLLRRYWQQLHPVIGDDGDCDARLASLEWLNESLGAGVRVHAVLFSVELDRPIALTLASWERLTAEEVSANDAAARGGAGAAAPSLSRADIHAHAQLLRPTPDSSGAVVHACLDSLRSLAGFLHERLHDEAPNLARLETVLEAALRVLSQFRAERPSGYGPVAPVADAASEEAGGAPGPACAGGAGAVAVPVEPVVTARWRNRHEAYATLEALADYLSEVEPHSPTPFLIRRAANWGRMSLPEVIAEIISQEGDIGRLFQIPGAKC